MDHISWILPRFIPDVGILRTYIDISWILPRFYIYLEIARHGYNQGFALIPWISVPRIATKTASMQREKISVKILTFQWSILYQIDNFSLGHSFLTDLYPLLLFPIRTRSACPSIVRLDS